MTNTANHTDISNVNQLIGIASYSEFRRLMLAEGTLLFTSALSGEGKTFLAIEVAISKALRLENRKPVLLVDLNSINRHAGKILLEGSENLIEPVGVVDVLEGKLEVEAALLPTDVEQLFLLPYGTLRPEFEPLQHLNTLRQLIEKLSERYQVIVDSGPVFLRNRRNFDPVEISQIVDSVILVVLAGKTPREVILRSKLDIETNGGQISGIVMNDRYVKPIRSELAWFLSYASRLPLLKQPIQYLQARLGLF